MKLLTIFELVSRSDDELHKLLHEAFNDLARSELHAPDRINALASIENITRVIGSRSHNQPPGP